MHFNDISLSLRGNDCLITIYLPALFNISLHSANTTKSFLQHPPWKQKLLLFSSQRSKYILRCPETYVEKSLASNIKMKTSQRFLSEVNSLSFLKKKKEKKKTYLGASNLLMA